MTKHTESQTVKRPRLPDDVERQLDRFWLKVEPEPNSGCWLWVGALQPRRHGSYGVFRQPGVTTTGNAHSFAYRVLRGQIARGLELDHRCRTPQCVNPWHLEAVPRRINLLRSQNIVAINARKTACPKGHVYDNKNTYIQVTAKGLRLRVCRACRRIEARERYRRNVGQNVRSYKPRFRPSDSTGSSAGGTIPA